MLGCTSAGEITSEGLLKGGLVGVGIASADLRMHTALIEPLASFGQAEAHALAADLRSRLDLISSVDIAKMFGFLLIDGLSMLEEQVLSALYWQFESMAIVGGSAGDDLKFHATHVFANGRFATGAAAFALFETTLPFKVFKTQHFVATEQKLVITRSDPASRTVYEINGLPARDEYARALGLRPDEFGAEHYSSHPLMLTLGNDRYVRSVSRINADGSLSFFAAIEDGLVLTLADGIDMVQDLRRQLSELHEEVGQIQLVLGCDCILRRLEILDKHLETGIREALADHNFVGFSTYGEQFNATHVNQTLTGVAIGT
jgi:hypothetical protein